MVAPPFFSGILGVINPLPINIINGKEVDAAIIKGVIWRPEVSHIGFVRKGIFGCIRIQVMISNNLIPGDSNARDTGTDWTENIEIVEHDIAERDAESCIGSDKRLDYIAI
ncbi:MAG: hypothetical protein CMJ96_07580 [Planctomycetes bacterium]|nr:hypothetical protein [Planctomycetota bacterium]